MRFSLDEWEIFFHYPRMTPTDIIAAFGGRQPMAQITKAKPTAVTQWRRIGIPAKYWPDLVALAPGRGVEGLTFDVLRATKPPRVKKASRRRKAA